METGVPLNSSEVVVEARDLWKSFDGGRIEVIRGASLSIHRGEIVALWGRSGSGKSTLLHLLSGLDEPDHGSVTVLGLNPRLESERLLLRRKHIGFVFQLHNLIPDLTLEENLRIPAMAARTPEAQVRDRIQYLATEVGLTHRLNHRIQDLSGGERQRTAICRALMNKPEVVFADEPTGSLDEETGADVFQLLCKLVTQEKVSVVVATHERRFMEECHRVICVNHGQAMSQVATQ
jgi:ABC-type lipoprotein export system ATPase subunit